MKKTTSKNKTKILSLLLATTYLSAGGATSALATPGCPSAVSGLITVSSASVGCYLNSGESILVTEDGIISDSAFPGIYANSGTTNFGSITVNGAIDGAEGGIRIDGGASGVSIVNTGTIHDTVYSETRQYGISFNSGSLSGGITNSGLISGESGGIQLSDGSAIGDIDNEVAGIIQGDNVDAIIINDSSVGDINNYGSILGNDNGVTIFNGSNAGSITNYEGGLIQANGLSNAGFNIANATLEGITNNGTIEGGAHGITIQSGSTVSGGITNTGSIYGSSAGIKIDSTSNVGAITNSGTIQGSKALDLDPTARVTVNNSGTLIGAVSINNSTLNLEDGSVVEGVISANDGGGILNINTDFTANTNYYLQDINISSGNTFTANSSTFTTTGLFHNQGTLSVGSGEAITVSVNSGDYTQDADATLKIWTDSASNHGRLNVYGTGTFAAGTNIFVDVGDGAVFNEDDRLDYVIFAYTLDATTFNVTDNSLIYDFLAEITTGEDGRVDLVLAAASENAIGDALSAQGNTAGKGAAAVLDQLVAEDPSGDMGEVVTALGTLSTASEVSDAVSQTLPVLVGGSTTAIIQTLDTTSRIVQARQETNSGLSSGDEFSNKLVWLKPFGTWANQSNKDNITGFEADTYGLIAGADKVASDNIRLGAAFAYANTDMNSNDGGRNKLQIDTYQATFYGSYSLEDSTDLNFQVDAGFNQNDSKRLINFGGLDRTAKGDFNSYSLHAATGIGRIIKVGDSTTFTPSARLDYTIINNESYTESEAGALNLRVKSQTTDQLIPALEVKFNHKIDSAFSLTANGGVGYDVLSEQNSVTSSYVGGGAAFVTDGLESSPWLFRSGAGVTYNVSDSLDLNLRYDREDRGSDFDAQTVSLKARMPF